MESLSQSEQDRYTLFLSIWPRYFAVAALLFSGIFLCWRAVGVFSLLSGLFLLFFLYSGRSFWRGFGITGGVANTITALRVVGILLLLAFQTYLHHYVFFVVGILILVADGLDGYYARKHNTVSDFGDFFDKETDAFFVLAFCIILVEQELLGAWIILPGLMRYAFVLILYLFNIEHIVLGKSYRRRFVGMWFMGSMMGCFVLPEVFYTAAMVFATAMLAYSFMKDFFLMLKQRPYQG